MNYYTYFYALRGVAVVLVALAAVAVPTTSVAQAAVYVWGGQVFSTEAEMHNYIREYVAIRNELYGTSVVLPTYTYTTSAPSRVAATQSTAARSLAVTSRSAEEVTYSGARLVGRLDRSSVSYAKVWFEYGTDWRNLWFATAPEVLDRDFGSRTFDRKVENLLHDTNYYYRAVVQNSAGVRTYGALRTFRTDVDVRNTDADVRVSTGGVYDITDDRARLSANVSFSKDGAFGTVWFEYGDDPKDLYKKTPKVSVSKAAGDRQVTYTIRGLDERTTYYMRAVAYDERGVKNYGATRQFTTRVDIVGEKPTVMTTRVSDIAAYSATISGSVAMNDFRNGVVFFVYGEDSAAIRDLPKKANRYSRIRTDGDNLQKVLVDNDLDREGEYTATVTNLDFKTLHYYTIGVEYEDDDGNEWILLGSVQQFTTKLP